MKNKNKCILSCLFALAVSIHLTPVESCFDDFDNIEMMENKTAECEVKLGLTEKDMPKTEEEYYSQSYDDKCLSECFFEKMNLLDDKKNLVSSKIPQFITDHAPKALVKKMQDITDVCMKAYEKQKAATPTAKSCKLLLDFDRCVLKEADKLCPEK